MVDSYTQGGISEKDFNLYKKFITNIVDSITYLASSGLLTGPLIHIKRCFKTLYSLRLINADFGSMLEGFFQSLKNGFEAFDTTMKNQEKIFFVKTRGKLTDYGISTLSNNFMAIPYTMYILSRLFSLYEVIFKSKMKSMRKMTGFDLRVVIIADKIRSSLFLSSVYDIALYSTHELLHHDLKVDQSYASLTSYIISTVVLLLIVGDLVRILWMLKSQKISKFVKVDKFRRNVQKVLDSEVVSASEKKEILEVEAMFLREFPFKFSAEICFFTNGLNFALCKDFSSFGINLISLCKALLMVVIVNSFQVLPLTQLLLVLGVQITFFVYLVHKVFWKRVFIRKQLGYLEVVSEFCILVFLGFGLIFSLFGREGLPQHFRVTLQTSSIVILMIGSLLNIYFAVILSIDEIFYFYYLIKTTFQKLTINKELKNLDEFREKLRAKLNQIQMREGQTSETSDEKKKKKKSSRVEWSTDSNFYKTLPNFNNKGPLNFEKILNAQSSKKSKKKRRIENKRKELDFGNESGMSIKDVDEKEYQLGGGKHKRPNAMRMSRGGFTQGRFAPSPGPPRRAMNKKKINGILGRSRQIAD